MAVRSLPLLWKSDWSPIRAFGICNLFIHSSICVIVICCYFTAKIFNIDLMRVRFVCAQACTHAYEKSCLTISYTMEQHFPRALINEYISGEVNVGGESAPYRSTVAPHLSHEAPHSSSPLSVRLDRAEYGKIHRGSEVFSFRSVQIFHMK